MIDPFFLIPNSERCLDLRDGDDGARILMRSLEAKVGWRDRRGAKFSLPHDWLSNTVHHIPSDHTVSLLILIIALSLQYGGTTVSLIISV